MAEGLRDHQESNESEVCDDAIDVPNPIPSLLDKCPSTPDLARQNALEDYICTSVMLQGTRICLGQRGTSGSE